MLEVPLSEPEYAALQRALYEGTQVQQYRAQAVLFSAEGKTLHEIAAIVPMATGQITYWLRRFGSERTELFAPADNTLAASAALPISRPDIAIPRKGRPDISADDPMSEAGRKIMAYYLSRLLHHERLGREGGPTEAIYDMRVACGPLRTALDRLGPYSKERAIKG